MEINLEHVRSFSKKYSIPLRPLTLLVGENSSGKSTFLSVVSSVLDAVRFPFSPRFNEPPYNLGTFDTIATYRGGKYGRDEKFSIGFSVPRNGDHGHRTINATYGNDYGNVVLRKMTTTTEDGVLNCEISNKTLSGNVSLASGDGRRKIEFDFTREIGEAGRFGQNSLRSLLVESRL